MHIVDTGEFVAGCVFGVGAIYFLLGLFSKAPWLHTDGRRKDGRWVVVRLARYDRIACVLASAAFSLTHFDSAFHEDASGRGFIFLLAVGVCVALLLWLGRVYKKKAQKAA